MQRRNANGIGWTAKYLAVLALGACDGDPEVQAAADAFRSFQAALQQGDRAACRALLTQDSVTAVEQFPWDRLRQQQQLVLLDATRASGCFHLRVRDPNEADRESTFVVAREYGHYRVDLLATIGLQQSSSAPRGPAGFTPRALTAADHDRLRQQQLASPPR